MIKRGNWFTLGVLVVLLILAAIDTCRKTRAPTQPEPAEVRYSNGNP